MGYSKHERSKKKKKYCNILGHSKHEHSTIKMLYSLIRICRITPLPPHNGHFSTTA